MEEQSTSTETEPGAKEWWVQRLTAEALITLTLWFGGVVIALRGAEQDSAIAWLGTPFNMILLMLLTVIVSFHAVLGMKVIIEDYVHVESLRNLAIIAVKVFFALIVLVSLITLLSFAFTG